MSGAALRQLLREIDADRIGLPEILAQDVAQHDVQHRRGGVDSLLLERIGRRIGEEAHDRLRLWILTLLDLHALRAFGKAQAEVVELRRRLAL